jgi:hypothetical protein
MPRGRPRSQDQTTLQMALVGYEIERQRIEDKIREIQALLGHARGRPRGSRNKPKAKAPAAGKRTMSAAARARIAAAQRRRWAAHRKRLAAEARG